MLLASGIRRRSITIIARMSAMMMRSTTTAVLTWMVMRVGVTPVTSIAAMPSRHSTGSSLKSDAYIKIKTVTYFWREMLRITRVSRVNNYHSSESVNRPSKSFAEPPRRRLLRIWGRSVNGATLNENAQEAYKYHSHQDAHPPVVLKGTRKHSSVCFVFFNDGNYVVFVVIQLYHEVTISYYHGESILT